MKTVICTLLLAGLVAAQDFEREVAKQRIVIFNNKRVIVQQNYSREKNKEIIGSQRELGLFDADFGKYVKEKPVLDEKELRREIKKQEQKVLNWCKKHQKDIGVLTGKDTCKDEALAWPIQNLSNKQLDDLITEIFDQSNITCFLWDLSEPISSDVNKWKK